jgi:CCR4-NOT transcription complex subunit 7/8
MNSELVLNEEIIWVAFHGGHDFAYLIKMLLNNEIPDKAE